MWLYRSLERLRKDRKDSRNAIINCWMRRFAANREQAGKWQLQRCRPMVCQNDGNGYSKENSDIKKGPDIHRAAALLVE